MIFLAATGTINPRKIHLNGDHAIFVLQDHNNEYPVKTMGREQYKIVQNYLPGQSMFILGTAINKKKILITPSLILSLDQMNGQADTILQITLQIMESHLWAANRAK